MAAWLKRWEKRYPRLTDWAEENIGETLTFYRLPRQHHRNMKSTNLLERLNEEIKRRTRVVRIFPNPASCPRLVRALSDWVGIEGTTLTIRRRSSSLHSAAALADATTVTGPVWASTPWTQKVNAVCPSGTTT